MSENTSQTLARIQSELTSIVDERLRVLEQTLATTEELTRRLIKAEMEIEHLGESKESMEAQCTRNEEAVLKARKATDALRAQNQSLTDEREKLRTLESELLRDSTSNQSEVELLRERVASLEGEAEGLRNENTGLRTKLKTLEENIARMRQLKDELMSSISGLTAQMTDLASGDGGE